MAPSKKNGTDGKKSAVKATAGEAAMKASIAADTKAANDTKMAAKTSRQKKPRLKTKPRPAPSVVSPSSTAVAPSDNGRGFIDPAAGPGRLVESVTVSPLAGETGAVDTDSGEPGARDADQVVVSDGPGVAPVDQDG